MKKSLVFVAQFIVIITVIGMMLVPSGVSLADQAFQTVRAPLYSVDEISYPLDNGFVVVTHMNGPELFEVKEFQIHGAKPNTQYFIYRVFQEDLLYHGTGPVIVPAGTKLFSGFSFWTDEHGNGHILTPLAPDAPALQAIKGTVSFHIKDLLYDGPLPGGTLAYETDWRLTILDWEWTP